MSEKMSEKMSNVKVSDYVLSKSKGFHSWWLNINGEHAANFDEEKHVDLMLDIVDSNQELIAKLQADNELLREALEKVSSD